MAINPFLKSLERLNRGFVIIKQRSVDFINPSLKDFLINYIQKDERELELILSSIRYAKQFSELLLSMAASKKVEIPDYLKNDFMNNYSTYLRSNFKDEDLINIATIISEHVKSSSIRNDYLVEIINDVSDWESLYNNYEQNLAFQKFVQATKNNYEVSNALKERTEDIVNDLFKGENDLDRSVELLEDLSNTFKIDYSNFDSREIISHLDELFSEYITNEVDNLKDWATDTFEVGELNEHLKNLHEKIIKIGIQFNLILVN